MGTLGRFEKSKLYELTGFRKTWECQGDRKLIQRSNSRESAQHWGRGIHRHWKARGDLSDLTYPSLYTTQSSSCQRWKIKRKCSKMEENKNIQTIPICLSGFLEWNHTRQGRMSWDFHSTEGKGVNQECCVWVILRKGRKSICFPEYSIFSINKYNFIVFS